MVVTYDKFDFASLHIAADTKQNKAGGKFASIGYGDAKQQVKFQLGGVKEALGCPFGIDKDSKFGKTTVKLVVAEPQRHFVEKLETTVLEAAQKSAWFKKALSKEVLSERLYGNVKKSEDGDCIRLKIEESGSKKTSVMVAEWRDAKLTKPRKRKFELDVELTDDDE